MQHQPLIDAIPKLRRQAYLITRNRPDADDLVQDTLALALGAVHDPAKGALGAWLRHIMRNAWIMQRRRDKFHGPMPEYWDQPVAAGQGAHIEAGRAVDAVEQLPVAQRAAVIRAALGEEYAEIALDAGVPIGTIKSRVSLGRKAVRKVIYG